MVPLGQQRSSLIKEGSNERYAPPSSVEDPVDQFNLGLRYSKSRRSAPKIVFDWYRKAAKQGFAPAQHNLAVCYAAGIGTSQDEVLAAHWFRKAAQQGHAPAQCNLGSCYALGAGVPADDSMAFSWTYKVAVQGEVSAQYNLGCLYSSGRGIGISYSIAAAWFKKAADQGSDLAEGRYREMRERGVKPACLSGLGKAQPKKQGDLSKERGKRQSVEAFRRHAEDRSFGRIEVTLLVLAQRVCASSCNSWPWRAVVSMGGSLVAIYLISPSDTPLVDTW